MLNTTYSSIISSDVPQTLAQTRACQREVLTCLDGDAFTRLFHLHLVYNDRPLTLDEVGLLNHFAYPENIQTAELGDVPLSSLTSHAECVKAAKHHNNRISFTLAHAFYGVPLTPEQKDTVLGVLDEMAGWRPAPLYLLALRDENGSSYLSRIPNEEERIDLVAHYATRLCPIQLPEFIETDEVTGATKTYPARLNYSHLQNDHFEGLKGFDPILDRCLSMALPRLEERQAYIIKQTGHTLDSLQEAIAYLKQMPGYMDSFHPTPKACCSHDRGPIIDTPIHTKA